MMALSCNFLCVFWNGFPKIQFICLSLIILLYRLYLINSPVVRAEVLKFKEDGVRDIVKDVFLPWYNAYRFLAQNVQRLETVSNGCGLLLVGTSENLLYIVLFCFVKHFPALHVLCIQHATSIHV